MAGGIHGDLRAIASVGVSGVAAGILLVVNLLDLWKPRLVLQASSGDNAMLSRLSGPRWRDEVN